MMHSTHLIFPLLLASGLAWGQQSPPPADITTPSSTHASIETRTEDLLIEDTGARIEELRIGGESKSISVQPKGGMPAYQVAPKTGERTWKVLGF